MKSLGIVEITGLTAAVEALDVMLKTADVELIACEKALGGRLVTIIIQGDIAATREAVECGKIKACKLGKLAAGIVINNPHEEVKRMVNLSAIKLK